MELLHHQAAENRRIKTAAQQNADAAAEAQGIAAQLNAYQQQQIAAATRGRIMPLEAPWRRDHGGLARRAADEPYGDVIWSRPA